MSYQVSKVLLQLAMEDAAQQACRREIIKQLEAQGVKATIGDVNVDIILHTEKFSTKGGEIEWVD